MNPKNDRQDGVRDYLEKWGLLFEQLGATRMVGRIIGWLLICDPPHQSAKQIAAGIGTSLASVSVATRTLVQAAMIERIGMPAQRSVFFRVAPGVWVRLMRTRLGRIASMLDLADEGLHFVKVPTGAAGARLREICSYAAFMDREMPALLARWEKAWQREQRAAAQPASPRRRDQP